MGLVDTIKASSALKALADAGHDNLLADELNAGQSQSVPITIQTLMLAAPQTLAAIGSGADPVVNLDAIASRIRSADWTGVGSWADVLLALGKMPTAEHAAVESLVTAANVVSMPVTHDQVSALLNPYRLDSEGVARATPIDWSKI